MRERSYYQRKLQIPTERASGFGSPTANGTKVLLLIHSLLALGPFYYPAVVDATYHFPFIAGNNAVTARLTLLIFDDFSFVCLMLMDSLQSARFLSIA